MAFGFVGLYMGNTISGGLPLATGRVKARKARTTKVNDLVAVKAILWLDFFSLLEIGRTDLSPNSLASRRRKMNDG